MTQQTIGIIGGGQLGQMLTQAAIPLGFKVVVLDPNQNSPAAQVGAEQIVGDLYDREAILKLAEKADFITIEIEHLDSDTLESLAKTGKLVSPAPSTIKMIQDKYVQKQTLQDARLPVTSFAKVDNLADAKNALEQLGGQIILKTRNGGYDGRGNAVVKDPTDLRESFVALGGGNLYAEEFVDFEKELAVMVALGADDSVLAYPVVETIHARNICQEVLVPASISPEIAKQAEELATKTARILEGRGVFGIEMFLAKNGQLLINEIAPRVHNSGHYTIEACATFQFEQHIRAITGLSLGDTTMLAPAAAMVNILGEQNGLTDIKGLDKVLSIIQTSIHLYGKSPTKVDRKMGHITALGSTLAEARQRAEDARKNFSI